MKKLFLILFFGATIFIAHAQTPPLYWGLTGNTGTTNSHFIGTTATTDCEYLIFKTRNTQRMTLSSSASYLGLGITPGSASLHIHHQTDPRLCSDIIIVDPGFTGGGNRLLQLTTPATGSSHNNGFYAAYSNQKEFLFKQQEAANFYIEGAGGGLTIAPDGNVGIGITPSSQTKLDVNGSFKATNANITGTITGNALSAQSANITGAISSTKLTVNHTATTDWTYASSVYVNRNYTKALVVKNTLSNNEVFVVYGNGVLSTKKIFTEKIEITMSAMGNYWYDHVFYPDYKLRPLNELEQFIKQNYHLPEIPSAKEIEENGLDLGDMQGKLLMKVEELTLYIIEQEKQIKALENRLTEIENNNKGGN